MAHISARTVAALYATFATLALLLVATLMPPFQNADEPQHVYRADQISHGGMLCKKLSATACGGKVDSGLPASSKPFDVVRFHADVKVSRDMYAARDWGKPLPTAFSGSGVYPPTFYVPAAAGLAAARAAGAPVLSGLAAARLATGFASIAIGTMAVALAGEAANWMFAVLLLPMSFCLTAAAAQDAPILATTALAASLCRRANGPDSSPRLLAAASGLLALVAMARPPYASFALVLLSARAPLRNRLFAPLLVTIAVFAWALLNVDRVHMNAAFNGAVNPALQLRGLLGAPGDIPVLLANTWRQSGGVIWRGFVGRLGWLDVDLPELYYEAAAVMLAVTLAVHGLAVRLRGGAAWLAAAAILGAAAGIALLEYLTWSPVGALAIGGIQGRYFLAPALMIAVLPAGRAPRPTWSAWVQTASLAFPFVSIPITVNAIVTRYFLT